MSAKNSTFFLIANLAVSIFLLGACSSQPEAVTPADGTSKEEIKPAKILSEADQAAFQGAMRLNDSSYCEKIGDEEYKAECQNSLSDQKVLNDALATLDASGCEKMSTADKTEKCKIEVDVAVKEKTISEEKKQEGETGNEIVASGDYTRCSKELKDESQVNNCELNILLAKAEETHDISWCEKISNDAEKERCRTIYNENNAAQ